MDKSKQAPHRCVLAMLDYGRRYGGPDNLPDLIIFLRRAAESGDAEAQFLLGELYREKRFFLERAGIAELLLASSQEDHSTGPREALRWFEMAAAQGHSDAAKLAGLMYIGNSGMQKDYSKAIKWLSVAAQQDNPDAWFFMGQAYSKGWGVPRDTVEAARWFLRAAERGHSYAQGILATRYEKGIGVPADLQEALRWYQDAARGGHFHSAFRLGCLYEEGDRVDQNYDEAQGWFEQVVCRGIGPEKVHAMIRLGSIHQRGLAGVEDPAKAADLYKRAHKYAGLFAKELIPLTRKYLDQMIP
ncbi:MAG: tetratricopeptide repeat protein [Verrucomicrobiota bacterium]